MDIYKITPYLTRAKALLDLAEPSSLKYAYLELRFCLEVMAYRQLRQYGEVIPARLMKEWKADQIIRLLASFDPSSDQSGEISFSLDGPESGEWKALGSSEVISWRKFRKYYNKLGSYLHASKVPEESTSAPIGEVQSIVSELERVEKSSLIFALKILVHADCPQCGERIFMAEHEFSSKDLVYCRNNKCNALFQKQINELGEKIITPIDIVSIKCDCGLAVPLQLDNLLAPIYCEACSQGYRVDLAFSKHYRIT
ncbi:hypothetical protein [Pseudomonas sp. NBRC 111128]|uniref:hypothetical protein n=1 Tax=Pseudomonas sp. NBRC 111128 TaxID=1661043 RepID=UPI000A7BD733|nr:hypothetical protein [Pseudomonas sp. NBRC 111128]